MNEDETAERIAVRISKETEWVEEEEDDKVDEAVELIGAANEKDTLTQAEYQELVDQVADIRDSMKDPDRLSEIVVEPLIRMQEMVKEDVR